MIKAFGGEVVINGTDEDVRAEFKGIIEALYETGYKTPDIIRVVKEVLDEREASA